MELYRDNWRKLDKERELHVHFIKKKTEGIGLLLINFDKSKICQLSHIRFNLFH